MNLRAVIAFFVWVGFFPYAAVDAAVHKGTLETSFLPDVLYAYDYSSSAQLHSDLQLIVGAKCECRGHPSLHVAMVPWHCIASVALMESKADYKRVLSHRSDDVCTTLLGNKISLQLIEENETYQDLMVFFKDATITWNSTTGAYTDTTSLGDLSKWFSVRRTREGQISALFHSSGSGDEAIALAFKKSIVGLFSIDADEVWSRGVNSDSHTQLNSQSSKQHGGQLKTTSKLVVLDEQGCISSVEATETVQLEHTKQQAALLGQSVFSRSTLVLMEKTTPLIPPQQPSSLVADTLAVNMVRKTIPLTEVRQQLSDLLASDVCMLPSSSACMSKMADTLRAAEVEKLSQELLQGFTLEQKVKLVDAMALLDPATVAKTLKHLLLLKEDEVVMRALYHIAASVQPDVGLAEAVKALVSGSPSYRVREKAQLALGSVARRLRDTHPEEAAAIVDLLHSMLQHHTERRGADNAVTPNHGSILLGAIGNAGDPLSVQLLASHVGGSAGDQSGSHFTLSAKKVALKGLGSVATLESAQAIRAIAEDTVVDMYLRQLAVQIYRGHPHGNEDLTHLITTSHAHSSRSRRSVASPDTQVQNVSMPAVGWNRHFGSPNISVQLGRTTQNSFEISTDQSTSKYSFSLHDVTSFDTSLLLATGSQSNSMLRSEYCLEGVASYGANALTGIDPYRVASQFQLFSSIAPSLSQSFSSSKSSLVSSVASYNGLSSSLHSSLLGIPAAHQSVQSLLTSYKGSVSPASYDLKMAAQGLFMALNASLADMMYQYNASWKSISSTIDAILPSKPSALTSSLSVSGTTFDQSTYYVPFLQYAPQQALSNIFSVYKRTSDSYSDLKSSMAYFQSITDPHGPNRGWLLPAISLNRLLTNFSVLLDQLDRVIDLAQNSPSQTFNGVSTQEYTALQSSIVGYLVPALGSLNSSAQQFLGAASLLGNTFAGSTEAFQGFTNAYENARFKVDAIFGQRFIPGFPQTLVPCGQAIGCGSYPSTSGGLYRAGIDLSVPAGTKIGSPVPAMVQLLPASPSSPGYNTTSSLLITPLESSYTGIHFILTNVFPDAAVTSTPTFFPAGTIPATASVVTIATPSTTQGSSFIHLEAYKTLDGKDYPIDSTQFLQPMVAPSVAVTYACNDLTWYVGDQLVDYVPLATSGATQVPLGGAPLVTAVPNNEFPQPVDVVVTGGGSVSEKQVLFFQADTFMMVGSIPVEFAFTSVGSYQLNHSLKASFLTKSLTSTITPTLQASVQGSIKVGATKFAVVQIAGDIVKSSLSLTLQQSFSDWPLVANSTMDLTLAPTSLALTTQLVQLTGAGDFAGQEILTSSTLWEYSIPSVHRNEYDYEGLLVDPSPPTFAPLTYDPQQLGCYLRQIPGRPYNSPAFELEFNLTDPQSLLGVAFSVGSADGTGDYIPTTVLGGMRVFVPWHVAPATQFHVTVAAVNLNGLEGVAKCSLPTFDSSPPLARINPIRLLSGHPTKIETLLVLFDEYGLSDTQQVAIGTVPGAYGSDVMPWTSFNTSIIANHQLGLGTSALNLFSFSRAGRLLGGVIATLEVPDASSCASHCKDYSSCLSFDYASLNHDCILHGNIEGPDVPNNAPYNNTFATEPLQTADGYHHFERLGVGNSSWAVYSNLQFSHNQLYYINLNLTNRLGYANLVSSQPFLVDLSPPIARVIRNASLDLTVASGCLNYSYGPECIQLSGLPNLRTVVDGVPSATIFNGPVLFVDGQYTSITNVFTANWDGISDPESGIYSYGWCIGTSVGTCNIMPFMDPFPGYVNRHELWTSTGVAPFQTALPDGTYYVSVQAINNVVYGGAMATIFEHSTPYVIDTSPPVVHFLPNGTAYDASSNQLSLTYLAKDQQSPVAAVSLAIGLSPRDTQLLDWTDVGLSGVARVTVTIPNGAPAWIKLMATNQAGLHSITVASSPISVDRTPPTAGVVRDVARSSMVDLTFQSDNSTLCVYGAGFSDPDTGITSYQWGLGTTPGAYNVNGLGPVAGSELALGNVCLSGMGLVHGTTYYSTIVATNGAVSPLSVTVTSSGVRVDITPPVSGAVKVGPAPGMTAAFSSSLTTLAASWGNFSDAESGIASYVVTVQRKLPAPGVLSTLSIRGSVLNASWSQLALRNGDAVVITVQASNGAGLVSTATSNTLVIDITPPQLAYLVDGLTSPQDLDYFNSTDNLTSSWSVSDPQSGVVRVEGAVYQLQGGMRTRVLPNPSAPNATSTISLPAGSSSWTARGLQLVSGTSYLTSITFTNGANLRVEYITNGVLVDLTPPTMQYVDVFPSAYTDDGSAMVTVADPTEVEGRWAGQDTESSKLQYVVGVVDVNGTLVRAATSFGGERGGIVKGLSLVPGGLYRLVVTAVDLAGHTSVPAFSSTFIVAPGDVAGTVSDGDDPSGVDIDYTDEMTAVSATFSGFLSQTCGGIARFEWAIGEDPVVSKESVLPFTDSGVVVVGNGSGYAQVLLPGLDQYGNQPLFITVRGVTGCNRILESTSNGFIIDTTPPLLQAARAGLYALEYTYSGGEGEIGGDVQYETTPTYSATWSTADPESGVVGGASIKTGTYPGGGDIGSSSTVESFVRETVATSDGLSSYVTVSLWNNAGLQSSVVTNAVVVDTSPPQFGELVCPPFIPAQYDSSALTYNGSLSCIWRNVTDPESGIHQYSIAIGTSANDASVLNSTLLPGYSHQFSSPVLVFSAGVGYYVTLLAINNAGLSESYVAGPIYYQTTLPVAVGTVIVQPNVVFSNGSLAYDLGSAVCLLDTDVVQLYFSDFNDPLGIVRYEVGAGSDTGLDNLLSYTPFSPVPGTNGMLTTQLAHVWLNPQSREAIYFSVRGYDQAGLYSTMSSGPVFVVSSSNTLQDWIYDGPNLSFDMDYQIATNYTSSHFYFGVNCPIREFQWAVESADGLLVQDYITSTMSWQPTTSVNNTFFVTTDQVDLYNGETYRVLVQARDLTGRVYVLRSNGSAVTTKGLKTGMVRDGRIDGFELNFQVSLSTLSAHWFDFGDGSPEQAIAYYEVAVGSSREFPSTRSNVVPFVVVGPVWRHTWTGLSLVTMGTYYVTVRAHAVSGSWVDSTSNGVTVGISDTLLPGEVVLPYYQSDHTSITVYWTHFEGSLPVQSYQWALGTRALSGQELSALCVDLKSNYSSRFEVLAFKDVGVDTIGTATGLSLEHNATYFATVRAVDEAGQCVSVLSNPLLVDGTPPLTQPVTAGPNESSWNVPTGRDHVIYVQPGTDLSVSWESFPDQESGVVGYEVALVVRSTCGSLQTVGAVNYAGVGLGLAYTFVGPSLTPGVVYSVAVRATNRANLTSVGFSEAILVDAGSMLPGVVVDGTNWQADAIFQSGLGTLSASFAHTLVGLQGRACRDSTPYVPMDGGKLAPPTLVGVTAQSTKYQLGRVTESPTLGVVNISSTLDQTGQYLVSGAYQIPISFTTGRETVTMEIQSALGDSALQPYVVTSLVFVDSSSVMLAEFEQGGTLQSVRTPFGAVGLQIHPSRTLEQQLYPQSITLWSYNGDPLSSPLSVTKNTTLDLSVPHEYSLSFYSRQLDTGLTRSVELTIDNQLVAVLYDIPALGNATRLVAHVYTQDAPIPLPAGFIATPIVVAAFSDITMTIRPAGVCGYGVPFYSSGSSIVAFRAAAGTKPGDTSVRSWQDVLLPCTPCRPATQPCYNYGCNQTCASIDPYTFSFTLSNLTLSPGSYSAQLSGTSQQQGSSFPAFLPATYYITIEAVSASGRHSRSSSNGITIDTTPPLPSSPVLHYDVAYSMSEAVTFQGSNSTVMATWGFSDPESGVVGYEWAVGSAPYGQDLQPFTSVGTATQGMNGSLVGLLRNNVTYYATVRAYNGAGLSWMITSGGVTYVATSLNGTALALLVQVIALSRFVAGRVNQTVLVIQTESAVNVTWKNVFKDVKSIYWYIGSTVEGMDVLPRTEVDFGSSQSASIAGGLLYLNGTPFVNLSEIIGLSEGKVPDPIDSYFSFEPGRPLYHTVEFCNYVHRCVKVNSNPVLLLRPKDLQVVSTKGKDVSLVLTLTANPDSYLVLDGDYTVTVKTTGGLVPTTRLFVGGFNSTDIAKTYRSSVPYISNPANTMGQTSRVIARRFTDVAGPSFYVSFIGQASLNGPLLINTTFGEQLDPTMAVPELAYWDTVNQEWREVGATCGTSSAVDWNTYTIAAEVCSTVINPNITNTTFFSKVTQFIVIQISNFSINTPPTLLLPTTPLLVSQDTVVTAQLQYTDHEGDTVNYYLASLPTWGNASISLDGYLIYTPCRYCYGTDTLDVYIRERPYGFNIPLSDSGTLSLKISNQWDPPRVFLYSNYSSLAQSISANSTSYAVIDGNRTVATTVARVGAYTFDGYADELTVVVQSGLHGAAGYSIWNSMVGTPQSAPALWSPGSDIASFLGYITFVGLNITYLPYDPQFVGTDTIRVRVRDRAGLQSDFLSVLVEVVPSWCQNNGVCGGSKADPGCANITARRLGSSGYNCSCPSGYGGQFCQVAPVKLVTQRVCPVGVPLVTCSGNPCTNAVCPSNPLAVCIPNFCGNCLPQWYLNGTLVQCSVNTSYSCYKPLSGFTAQCSAQTCPCPTLPYTCPSDSILVEVRQSNCCVTFQCSCPNSSCPLLADGNQGVYPVAMTRGNRFPGTCCPNYTYADINECLVASENLCSQVCLNQPLSYSCKCPSGQSLAADGFSCGVCNFNSLQYLLNDRVEIGCNWCICQNGFTQERWNCTAHTCQHSCIYNGQAYPIGSLVQSGVMSCNCLPTDTNAAWSCSLPF